MDRQPGLAGSGGEQRSKKSEARAPCTPRTEHHLCRTGLPGGADNFFTAPLRQRVAHVSLWLLTRSGETLLHALGLLRDIRGKSVRGTCALAS